MLKIQYLVTIMNDCKNENIVSISAYESEWRRKADILEIASECLKSSNQFLSSLIKDISDDFRV